MIYSILIIVASYQKERSISCRNFLTNLTTLARNLISNICAGLIGFLQEIINADQLIKQHRQSPTDFIRKRKRTFSTLIFFLMNMVKGSYQDELDHFFKSIFKGRIPIFTVMQLTMKYVNWPFVSDSSIVLIYSMSAA